MSLVEIKVKVWIESCIDWFIIVINVKINWFWPRTEAVWPQRPQEPKGRAEWTAEPSLLRVLFFCSIHVMMRVESHLFELKKYSMYYVA